VKKGFNIRLMVFFTVLTLVLTAVVIVTWEQVLKPPYYAWVARKYPGPEMADYRDKIEQRGEHFFISMTVDVIVVSILLTLVNREHKRLVEAHERLAHTERISTLGRVAAQVAHEVRNPLAGLLLYSLHLRSKVEGELAASDLQTIDKIIETVNHLTSTTEQILNFARPVNLSPRWIDLNAITTDVTHLLKAQIEANGIDLRMELSDENTTGMLDEASIRAALLNLMLNAIQAMPDRGSVVITTGCDLKTLWLAITDNGPGIAPERVKNIFEPFNTTKRGGLGLGMPYAQKIVEQHQGKIFIQSQLGKGTEIRIELPRGKENK
jgi:signal transduction histidine kinase